MTFLEISVCEFNQTPIFSNFDLENDKFVRQFASILVEGAALQALGSRALLEKGREFSASSGALIVDPPQVSTLLQTQYEQLYTMHWKKLKYIKKYIRDFKHV